MRKHLISFFANVANVWFKIFANCCHSKYWNLNCSQTYLEPSVDWKYKRAAAVTLKLKLLFNESHIFLFSSTPSSFLSPLLYIYSLVSKCWLHIIVILSFPWSPDSCPCLRARSRRTRSSRGRSSPSWKRPMSSSSSPPLPSLSPSRVIALTCELLWTKIGIFLQI